MIAAWSPESTSVQAPISSPASTGRGNADVRQALELGADQADLGGQELVVVDSRLRFTGIPSWLVRFSSCKSGLTQVPALFTTQTFT